MTPILSRIVLPCAATALLAACATTTPNRPDASATIAPASGSQVGGTVDFYKTPAGLRVTARLSGLTPGEHGFHVHEVGDCSAPDASSAKGHFNPLAKAHGHHARGDHHAGDLPTLVADGQGNAALDAEVAGLSLSGDPAAILGRAIVVHADPDDYKSQPAGNSGKRIACGVIAAR